MKKGKGEGCQLSNMYNGFKFKKYLQGTDFQSLKPHEGPARLGSHIGNKDFRKYLGQF